jgi:DNA polymerase III delta prime subunit
MDVDKEAFVEQWLKDNKQDIVKAHASDIRRATKDLALRASSNAALETAKAENERLRHEAETWETKFKAANSSWQEERHMVEVWKEDCRKAQEQVGKVGPLKERVTELETEIIRLKARLFDMTELLVEKETA